jgi:CRISPR/Cas system CSM-associated protein Csm3 (group 7 of RAMP superfamily)
MKYSITFYDFWHLSSGTSAGPTMDSLVVKDSDGLPYLPGKTLKGLAREMAELLDNSKVKTIFGEEGSNIANSYFSNAILDKDTIGYLINNPTLKKHLFDKVTSTKIGENGIAEDKSLREIEVVVPLTLYGIIECEDEIFITQALEMIKQIGLNRNRGLGRCKIEVIK